MTRSLNLEMNDKFDIGRSFPGSEASSHCFLIRGRITARLCCAGNVEHRMEKSDDGCKHATEFFDE